MFLTPILFFIGAVVSGTTAFAGVVACGVAGLCKAVSMGCVLFSSMSAATGLLRGKF